MAKERLLLSIGSLIYDYERAHKIILGAFVAFDDSHYEYTGEDFISIDPYKVCKELKEIDYSSDDL